MARVTAITLDVNALPALLMTAMRPVIAPKASAAARSPHYALSNYSSTVNKCDTYTTCFQQITVAMRLEQLVSTDPAAKTKHLLILRCNPAFQILLVKLV